MDTGKHNSNYKSDFNAKNLSKEANIKNWKEKINQIRITGNCKNKINNDYFSPKYTPDEMVACCEKMIERLKNQKS